MLEKVDVQETVEIPEREVDADFLNSVAPPGRGLPGFDAAGPERFINREQFSGSRFGHGGGFVERNLQRPAATFGVMMAARVVNQDAPHQLRRDAEKMSAVLPLHVLLIYQPQVGFIDQRRGLQSVAGAFAAHVTAGELSQLGVDQRQQLIERRLVAVAPIHQQLGYIL